MMSLRSVILGGALAASAAAQASRPAPEVFVRIGERTRTPWPLATKDQLWVVTADPFVCDATLAYFDRTHAAMQLLAQVLGTTVEGIDGSEWAKTHAAEWTQLRKRLQDVADPKREREAESRLAQADTIDGSEVSPTARALRELLRDPLWTRAPFPGAALDARTSALWRAFHEVVRCLWGETADGWPGWFVRLAEAKDHEPPTSPWSDGEALLPRVPDLLSKASPAVDPLLDAPAWGATGVFTDLHRTSTHFRAALDRLTRAQFPQLSERDALYRCVRGLLDEHQELALACGRQTELGALLGSPDWQVARTESAAGLTVRARYGDRQSIVFGRPMGKSVRRALFRALLLVSPEQLARIETLEVASQRAIAAWHACVALLPGPRAAGLRSTHPDGLPDLILLRALRRLRTGDRPDEFIVIEGDRERDQLREELSSYHDRSLHGQFEAPLAAPDAPGGGGAAESWVRVPLAGRGLHAVEFRLWVDGDWRWGLGAMASCEVQKDGAWRPLRECWGKPR